MEYFKHIPDASLLNESTFVLDQNKIDILDQRASTPEEECLTLEDSNRRLKK